MTISPDPYRRVVVHYEGRSLLASAIVPIPRRGRDGTMYRELAGAGRFLGLQLRYTQSVTFPAPGGLRFDVFVGRPDAVPKFEIIDTGTDERGFRNAPDVRLVAEQLESSPAEMLIDFPGRRYAVAWNSTPEWFALPADRWEGKGLALTIARDCAIDWAQDSLAMNAANNNAEHAARMTRELTDGPAAPLPGFDNAQGMSGFAVPFGDPDETAP